MQPFFINCYISMMSALKLLAEQRPSHAHSGMEAGNQNMALSYVMSNRCN